MRVELDVFTGRPNPSWNLSATEGAELQQRLRALPRADPTQPADGGLGYRGLIVTGTAGALIGACTTITVANGLVSCEGPQGREVRLDEGRALERWLLDTGKERIAPELYALARQRP